MHKVTAHHDQEEHVRKSVAWNRKWDQSLGGLYFNEELSGPDGMSVQLFVTKDTPDLTIQAAAQQAYEEGDVVSIHALVVPEEWLKETDDSLPALASIDALQRIVDDSTAGEIRWPDGDKLVVDTFTASMLVKVHEKLHPELQEKVSRMIAKSQAHFLKVIDITWETVL